MNNKMGDSSYLKLKWNIQGIFDNFPEIERELEQRINQLPENNIKERKKITNWINQIKKIWLLFYPLCDSHPHCSVCDIHHFS